MGWGWDSQFLPNKAPQDSAVPKHSPCCRAAASPVAGQVLADFLLVVPEQAVQGQHVAVADEGQAVVHGVAGRAVGRDVQEKPARAARAALRVGRGHRDGGTQGSWGGGARPYLRAASKLLLTKSLKGRMCSSFVNSTWLAML